MKYDIWLEKVRKLLINFDYISDNQKLCPDSWKMYYEDGLRPTQAINADMGTNHGAMLSKKPKT